MNETKCGNRAPECKGGTRSPGQMGKADLQHLTLPSPQRGEGAAIGDGRLLVNRHGLALALGVSLRTVDRMLAAGEIVPVRMRGWTVRFYVPEVVRALTANAAMRKHGHGARAVEGPGAVISNQSSVASGQGDRERLNAKC